MILKKRSWSVSKKTFAGAALALGMLGGGVLAAGPASASGTNINYYGSGWYNCAEHNGNDFYCLWYSPGLLNGVWGSTASGTGTISASFTDGDGGVRNNAASMANDTSNCHVTTWVSPGYVGDFNWLNEFWGGNLTSGSIPLRNNEASINTNTCS
jgi:hypothetical protein